MEYRTTEDMRKPFFRYLLILGFGFITAFVSYGQYAGQAAVAGIRGNDISQSFVNIASGDILDHQDRLTKTTGIESFQGSPYVNNTFVPTVVSFDGEEEQRVFYRYNAFNEEVEVKKTNDPDEKARGLNKDKKIEIVVEGKPMSFKTFIDRKDHTMNGYLIQLVAGESYDLYKRIKVKFTEGQKAQNSFVQAIPNRFTHFKEYYFQQKGVDRIDEIPLKKNGLLKLLPANVRQQTGSFVKKHGLNVKDESALIEVFLFLNQ